MRRKCPPASSSLASGGLFNPQNGHQALWAFELWRHHLLVPHGWAGLQRLPEHPRVRALCVCVCVCVLVVLIVCCFKFRMRLERAFAPFSRISSRCVCPAFCSIATLTTVLSFDHKPLGEPSKCPKSFEVSHSIFPRKQASKRSRERGRERSRERERETHVHHPHTHPHAHTPTHAHTHALTHALTHTHTHTHASRFWLL